MRAGEIYASTELMRITQQMAGFGNERVQPRVFSGLRVGDSYIKVNKEIADISQRRIDEKIKDLTRGLYIDVYA